MGARTDAGGDEDDVIVDSRQLYMKFMDMVGKKQINIVHQSQAKKDNQNMLNNNKDNEWKRHTETLIILIVMYKIMNMNNIFNLLLTIMINKF